jgi:Protein of unknown function (DUF4446)
MEAMAGAALAVAVLALAGVILLLVRQERLLGQYRFFMTGATGASLEAVLRDHVAQEGQAFDQVRAVDKLARRLESGSVFHLQRLAIVRFNPFRDTGGDQSFAIALTDGQGNGVILSSLHARDMTRVYAKPLEGWQSAYTLTDEEKHAIGLAREQKAASA